MNEQKKSPAEAEAEAHKQVQESAQAVEQASLSTGMESQEEGSGLKGAEFDISFDKGQVKIKLEHVGKVGGATLELHGDARPFIDKLVDAIEKVIPGDQKAIADGLKSTLANLKF